MSELLQFNPPIRLHVISCALLRRKGEFNRIFISCDLITRVLVYPAGSSQIEGKSKSPVLPAGKGRGQTDKYWNSARQRWNYKLLGQNADSIAQARAADSKPILVEQYMPPTTTLMGYFVSKVTCEPGLCVFTDCWYGIEMMTSQFMQK